MSASYSTGVHEEEIGGPVYDQRLASRLLRYLRPYWREVLLAVSLLGAISLLEVAVRVLASATSSGSNPIRVGEERSRQALHAVVR